ncbi:hypothetical protein Taro_009092 [Colocasia esculenta]|uniref:Uncharacterized protein n=1 Tax=Colocasia esculenta TaxID=4460 RepID=A0A843U321_COLES|nr:hypothetical protein [Colocasia esculenta]
MCNYTLTCNYRVTHKIHVPERRRARPALPLTSVPSVGGLTWQHFSKRPCDLRTPPLFDFVEGKLLPACYLYPTYPSTCASICNLHANSDPALPASSSDSSRIHLYFATP